MMRSLWTAASGMTAQQLNVDTVANNLANVNTVSYKQETVNFKSLMYENMAPTNLPGENASTPIQVGHGVRAASINRHYGQGTIMETGNSTDMAIQGNGFFVVATANELAYTRDGSFRFSMLDDNTYALVTSDGHPVVSTDAEPIIIDNTISPSDLIINEFGEIYYYDDMDMREDIAQIQMVQFANREGLEAMGQNLYRATPASGTPLLEGEEDGLVRSSIRTGALEGSNVNLADEMVRLIIAQRAYELNSTTIKAADEMLRQANELKRV